MFWPEEMPDLIAEEARALCSRRQHDGGTTFGAPTRISDPIENRLTNKPVTVVDGNGRVYVVYKNTLLDDPQGRNRHVIQVSTDGGATFSAARLVALTFEAFVLSPMTFRSSSAEMSILEWVPTLPHDSLLAPRLVQRSPAQSRSGVSAGGAWTNRRSHRLPPAR